MLPDYYCLVVFCGKTGEGEYMYAEKEQGVVE